LENPNSNIPQNGPFANASEHGSVDRLECAMGVTPGVADSLFGARFEVGVKLDSGPVGASCVKVVCST
jgi:hypothetical protein